MKDINSLSQHDREWLTRKANELRISILKMVVRANGGHIGGAFSIIDIMTALYFQVLRHDPQNPTWSERDRLFFSKGHSCLALYTVLAETGYFGKDHLEQYNVDGGLLAGHPVRDVTIGVEITAGSLGHGLSLGVGTALAGKLDGASFRTFVVLGDGECNEGSVWEAFMSGGQFKLDNLIAIVDSNKYESLGTVSEIMSIEPLGERLRSFGWSVQEIDGHNMCQIIDVLGNVPFEIGKPSAVVAHTIKGKGVSFMENVPMWHYRAPTPQEAGVAFSELERAVAK